MELVVCGDRDLVHFGNLRGDALLHLADPSQVGIDLAFALLVEDALSVDEDFHDALAAGGNGDSSVRPVGPEKLIRHPRGGSEMLSRNAISDLYLDLSFHVSLLWCGKS